MEIIEESTAFVQKDDDFIFDHTKVIVRRKVDNQYFYGRIQERVPSSAIDIDKIKLVEIPTDDVWPVFDPKFTRAPQSPSSGVYVKRPSILAYGDIPDSYKLSDQVLSEVEVCETLRKNPHPNIVQYLGCNVEDDRITGLCLAKYDITLSDKQKLGDPIDVNRCLQGIRRGVDHLHGLGLVHNDLNPNNIMMDGDDPVIIDFDSCRQQGQELGLKGGTFGWCIEGLSHADFENDFDSISKIHDFLMRGHT
ncbi:serine/threonine kinase [Xylaria grammica]|nr:serine/threonine kinase [Xylaria grammica]